MGQSHWVFKGVTNLNPKFLIPVPHEFFFFLKFHCHWQQLLFQNDQYLYGMNVMEIIGEVCDILLLFSLPIQFLSLNVLKTIHNATWRGKNGVPWTTFCCCLSPLPLWRLSKCSFTPLSLSLHNTDFYVIYVISRQNIGYVCLDLAAYVT